MGVMMAGTIIVVGNEKGGCGKTTISTHVAAHCASLGRHTVLVDADPGQQSAARWASRRRELHPDAPEVQHVTLTGRNIRAALDGLAREHDLLVVDTGAEDSPEMRAAATLASALIIPLQPEPLDLWALPTVAKAYIEARRHNPGLRAIVALNRIAHQNSNSAPAETRAWIEENLPILPVEAIIPLVNRAAYGRAIGAGLTVSEAPKPDSKATAEMAALCRAVLR